MTDKRRIPRSVSAAERNFNKAEDNLIAFKEENHEFMDRLIELVGERERARERLLAQVSDHRVGAAGMQVSIARPRKFHGEFLYHYLPDEVRDQVVSIVYKVDPKAFDRAVKEGLIEKEQADESFEHGDEKVSIRKQIKPISLG